MPIGVFDSGLGGLTVLRALTHAAPDQRFVYLGDNANAPYGARGPQEVFALTTAGVERLFDEGCDLAILACNTASAVALRRIQCEWLPAKASGRRVLGVFVPVIEALTGRHWAYAGPPTPSSRARKVLLFATPATVRSGAFPRELAFRATGIEVTAQACPGLVDALEAGDDTVAAGIAAEAAREALARAGGAADAVVLGCTHYPLVEAAFRATLPGIEVLSQPRIAAQSLLDYLARHPRFVETDGGLRCLTTGDPACVGALAGRFFGRPAAFESA